MVARGYVGGGGCGQCHLKVSSVDLQRNRLHILIPLGTAQRTITESTKTIHTRFTTKDTCPNPNREPYRAGCPTKDVQPNKHEEIKCTKPRTQCAGNSNEHWTSKVSATHRQSEKASETADLSRFVVARLHPFHLGVLCRLHSLLAALDNPLNT